jgi:serine protease Do
VLCWSGTAASLVTSRYVFADAVFLVQRIPKRSHMENYVVPPLFKLGACLLCLWMNSLLHAVEDAAPQTKSTETKSTVALTAEIRDSLVTIRVGDRDGDEVGMGTGFVVDEKGLIATNLHVIREGRKVNVELWPNIELEVLAIEATSRSDDLAIIRVAPGKHKLKPIPLGDKNIVAQGVEVLAFGNPHGLRHSVVQGVVSAVREIESRQMIQVAMPIEPGNSGGPLVDREGIVRGIVNMKSLKAENIGFAIPIGRLLELMESTNPITLERWVRLAGVDEKVWKPLLGAQWRERSGIIDVSGAGTGFGGRSLCLYQPPVPAKSFEVAVQVKLDKEVGAAGLVFHADGQDKHYGFYPTNGSLRLTCFQGSTVYAWEIVSEVSSKHYLPGQWNYLKVRVQPPLIQCFVNGELVIESEHSGLTEGQVGLVKFRDTHAEFRQFRLDESIQDDVLSKESREWFEKMPDLTKLMQVDDLKSIEILAATSEASSRELLRQAQRMSRQVEHLRRMAADVRITPLLHQLSQLFATEEPSDLLTGALLIAALDHPDLDVEAYIRRIDAMASEVAKQLPEDADEEQKLKALDHYLFEENGFHGGQEEYYHEANNHLDRVIDDREGMPITLAVLYIELGRRLELNIEGIGLPGHFIVRHRPSNGTPTMIDVFDKAKRMTDEQIALLAAAGSQFLLVDGEYPAQRPLDILVRILRNLLRSAERIGDFESMRAYAEGLVALRSDEPEFRLMRGIVRYQTDRLQAASEDFEWLLNSSSPTIDPERVQRMHEQLQRAIAVESQP